MICRYLIIAGGVCLLIAMIFLGRCDLIARGMNGQDFGKAVNAIGKPLLWAIDFGGAGLGFMFFGAVGLLMRRLRSLRQQPGAERGFPIDGSSQ